MRSHGSRQKKTVENTIETVIKPWGELYDRISSDWSQRWALPALQKPKQSKKRKAIGKEEIDSGLIRALTAKKWSLHEIAKNSNPCDSKMKLKVIMLDLEAQNTGYQMWTGIEILEIFFWSTVKVTKICSNRQSKGNDVMNSCQVPKKLPALPSSTQNKKVWQWTMIYILEAFSLTCLE